MAFPKSIKWILSNCNVELVVIVYGVAMSISTLVTPLAIYQVVCQQTLHGDFEADFPPAFQNSTRKLICESMSSKNFANETAASIRRLEFEVQETAAYWFMMFGIAHTLPGVVSDVVLAAYSDRNGRKKVILLGLFGVLVVMVTVPLMYQFPLDVPMSVVVLAHVVAGATGFVSSLLSACAAYLVDTVEDQEKLLTVRMTILQVCQTLPVVLGPLLASGTLKAIDYAQVMIVAGCLTILAFVYALVSLKKIEPGKHNAKAEFEAPARVDVQVHNEFEYPTATDARSKIRFEHPTTEAVSQVQDEFGHRDRTDAHMQAEIEIPASLEGSNKNNGQMPSKSQPLDPTGFGRPKIPATPDQTKLQEKIKFPAKLERLVQSSESLLDKIKRQALASWLLIKSVWDTYAKPREGHSRAYLWLMGLVFLVCTTTDTASHNNIFSLYVQKTPFLWREDMISYYKAAVGLLKLAGAMIGAVVMKKIIHLPDTLIILLSTLSSMVQLILTAFAQASWMLFVAAGAGVLSALANPCIQSFVAKLVAADEVGKSYTAFSLASNFAYLVSSTLTGAIYRATLSYFPGLMFLIMAMLLITNFIAVAWMHLDSRKQSSGERGRWCIMGRKRKAYRVQ